MKKSPKILLGLVTIIVITIVGISIYKSKKSINYESIAYVNDKLSDVFSDNNYDDYDIEEKKEICKKQLDSLEEDNYIKDVKYVEESYLYEFKYSDGTYGGIMIEEFNEEYAGASKNYAALDNNKKVKNINNEVDLDISGYPYEESNLKAKVMYGLGYDEILDSIEDKTEVWNNEYLKTAIDTDCTVEDFASGLTGYNYIEIAEHGSFYENTPVICTQEIVTEENQKQYKDDLQNGNIIIVTVKDDNSGNQYYWIMPSFFEKHYKNNELDGSIILLECCFGYKNDKLVKAIKNAGADCVIGNTEEIYSWYIEHISDAFIYSLLYGDTASEALNYAKSIWGDDDTEWREIYLTEYVEQKENAEPSIYCGEDVTLVTIKGENEDEEAESYDQALQDGELCYISAMETYWGEYSVEKSFADGYYSGIETIYNFDYKDIIELENEDGYTIEFIRINSIENVKKRYTSKGFKQYLKNNQIQKIDGKYYIPYGDRGSDFTYQGHNLKVDLDDITSNKITFTSVETYDDPNNPVVENKFVIIKEDGDWKIDEFTLPN